MREKSAFRQEMLRKRSAMGMSARAGADQRIFERITALPAYQRAKTIFCYVSVTDEPDTRKLIRESLARGKRICVPRCENMGIMHACIIRDEEDLVPGKYGIPEPAPHCAAIAPEDIDLIIAPCVCCDRQGYRIGYGGGFYDRWLATRRVPALVICFEEMLVDEAPREPHDERADMLVTDLSIRNFKNCFHFKIVL